MKKDPRDAKDLDEAALNEDGTYNGFAVLSWVSKMFHPEGISEEEIRQEYAKKKALREQEERKQ